MNTPHPPNPIINEQTRLAILAHLEKLRALQPELDRAKAAGFDVLAHQTRLNDYISRLNSIYHEYFGKNAV